MYTPAIEHSACPLVDGKCGNERHLISTDLRTDDPEPSLTVAKNPRIRMDSESVKTLSITKYFV